MWFDRRAAGWWLARLVVEGMAGAAAVVIARAVSHLAIGELQGTLIWIVIGAAAPRILGQQLAVRDHNINPFALLYDRRRHPLNDEIDAASADAQGLWVEERIKPAVASGH